ncbi:exodeoxyribonuclease III, partial [Campylobacter sp. 50012-21]|nr:exodeoxyribonuclease III [Campylobacter magnus]
RERNVGWRIDYFFVSSDLVSKVKNADILADITGSDHCPVMLEIDL